MQSINFEVGTYKEYAINGDENNTIRIDVSDLGFVDRFRKAMSEIEAAQKEYENIKTPSEDILSEIDSRVRGIVNRAFDCDVCTKAFGNKNCLSVTANGEPILINFLSAFIPIIKNDFSSAIKTEKYTKPIISQQAAAPQYVGMIAQPSLDVSSLTQEQKNALLRELIK